MGIRRARLGSLVVAVIVASAVSIAPTPSTASTGEFTKATADATWSKGKIAGSVTWDGCPLSSPSKCTYWKPYVLLQPALPSYSCAWQDAWDSNGDRNIRILWAGNTQTSPGTKLTFDLPEATLFSGVQGQRVCLVAFIPTKIPNQVCINQNKVLEQLGFLTSPCPLMDGLTGEVINQAILTEETVAPPPGGSMSLRKATAIAKRKLASKYGISWKSGSSRKVKCREKSALFVCSASWRSKGKPKKGSVLVFKP